MRINAAARIGSGARLFCSLIADASPNLSFLGLTLGDFPARDLPKAFFGRQGDWGRWGPQATCIEGALILVQVHARPLLISRILWLHIVVWLRHLLQRKAVG